jgi:hypothetical protein
VLHVDVEDPLEQPRPADAVRMGLNRIGISAGCVCRLSRGLCLCGRGLRHHQRMQLGIRGQHPMFAQRVRSLRAAK